MTNKKCRLCSQPSSTFKNFFSKLVADKKLDCEAINLSTYESGQHRVSEINKLAPDCNCENYRMSKYSSGVVQGDEIITRFVFSPIHVSKNGQIKPSIFSHVHDRGCSIQRDKITSDKEAVNFVHNFLKADGKRSWFGVVQAICSDIRNITDETNLHRSICIYDTAEKTNPAHGEIAQSQYIIEEADRNELRHHLNKAFNDLKTINPNNYRSGKIWENLPAKLKGS